MRSQVEACPRVRFECRSLLLVPALLGAFAVRSGAGDEPKAAAPDVSPYERPSGPRVFPRLAEMFSHLEEMNDQYETEEFHNLAKKQLGAIGKAFLHPGGLGDDLAANVATSDYTGGALRPGDLAPMFQDGIATVLRPSRKSTARLQKHAGFLQGLAEMRAPFGDADPVSFAFKIFQIDPGQERIATTAYIATAGQVGDTRLQQNATWRSEWVWAAKDSAPLLASTRIEAYEEVVTTLDGKTLFSDCTEAVLARNPAYARQILPHHNLWRRTLDAMLGVGVSGMHGIALGDVDGDGLEDLYSCQSGGLPNLLFVQGPDGTACEVGKEAGVDFMEATRHALFADLDNDGDQDLIVLAVFHALILENDGRGRFEKRAELTTPSATSLASADYDGDGRLDLYICCYSPQYEISPPMPYHDANNGSPNFLFRNLGDWRFDDVTKQVGLDENNTRYSFAACFEDYDNDRDLDLYVANDFGRNNLYEQEGGRFRDVAARAGVEDISAGMGVTWGDYDNDGLMDLYVSNMFSSAGGRVAYQRHFQPAVADSTRRLFQRHARGNSLYRNLGNGTFADVSDDAAVTMGRWAWGAMFVDLNNDGAQDIVVPNGYITNESTHDL